MLRCWPVPCDKLSGADSHNPNALTKVSSPPVPPVDLSKIITIQANAMDSTSADKRLRASEQSHNLCVAPTSSDVQWGFALEPPGEIDTPEKYHF